MYVNEEDIRSPNQQTPLKNGDEISIIPPLPAAEEYSKFQIEISNPSRHGSKARTTRPSKAARPGDNQKTRLWLMYPPRLITTPVIWQLSKKFEVVTNVRQASVTDEIGIVCLELEGKRDVIKAAIKWLERLDISVEPVEINVIES